MTLTPEQLKAEREALARECGATFYKNRHSPHEPAVAFSPTAWEKFIAAQAQRADVQDAANFEFVAPGLRSFGMQVPTPREYGRLCREHGIAEGEKRAATTVASLTARVAELEALCKQAEEKARAAIALLRERIES